ncbi:GNAT family N-acetyltransferase OS=Streptomyces microflavus OX=1919 GN=G3I39_05655 PE=3 SV=1 [Streptomyces microflavus]
MRRYGGAYSFRLTVPGARRCLAGVTAVSVAGTHRRRGLLRTMMRRQLDDVRSWGEPLAVLTASEPAIYGRFGTGPRPGP